MKLLRNYCLLFTAALALLIFNGCTGLETTDGAPATAAPQSDAARNAAIDITTSEIFRPGEQLTIELLDVGSPQKIEQAIADDGTITLPLLSERVQAAGKKAAELQDDIRGLYVPKIYKRLTVNIKRENRFYWVRGEVRNPGQRVYTGDITVTKAIASSGDFTEFAKRNKIEIIRSNGKKTKVNWKDAIKNPQKHDLPIYPGDTVHVPQSIY